MIEDKDREKAEKPSTWKVPPAFTWRSEDCMESVLVFPDGGLEISVGGKGMCITPKAIIEKLWGNRDK